MGAGGCVEHGVDCAQEAQDAHHIVKAQLIRAHLLPLRMEPEDLWAIMFDPRIGVRVCRPFHRKLDGHDFKHGEHTYLRPEQVPWQAITYCQDHNLMVALRRAVPEIDVA